MFIYKLKSVLIFGIVLALCACSSNARYHEIQSARLDECAHMADKQYHTCIQRQQDSYKKFKEQQLAAEAEKHD